MGSGSAEARSHHELWEEAGGVRGADVAPLQEHKATWLAGCHQGRPIPEGEKPEGTFTQNCRQVTVLVQRYSGFQSYDS